MQTSIDDDTTNWDLYNYVAEKYNLHKAQHGKTCDTPDPSASLTELGLTIPDLKQLTGGEWLTDRHMNGVNKLLLRQFPGFNGFNDPLMLAVHDEKYASSNFVQIVNISCIHWVCVSNVLSSPGVVEVYDSKPNCSVGAVLHRQVAKLLRTAEKSFELKYIDVQRQRGSSDCGLYAIANATTLCYGGDPHITSYNQEEFRAHLARCFESRCMTMFPAADRPRRLGRKRVLSSKTIDVFCTCRLPWNKDDYQKGPLVQCQLCKEWYHEVCMDINKDIINYPGLKYNCKLCLNID